MFISVTRHSLQQQLVNLWALGWPGLFLQTPLPLLWLHPLYDHLLGLQLPSPEQPMVVEMVSYQSAEPRRFFFVMLVRVG